MDFPRDWQRSLPNQLPEQAARSQSRRIPPNISSYFGRPAKIAKPSSRGNSPKTLSRRRTTASHSTRHHAALQGSISNCGVRGSEGNAVAENTRPISWHPNSVKTRPLNDWAFSQQFPDSTYPMQLFTDPFATAEVNGLITPLSQPSSAESCYQEGFIPLEEMPMQNLDNTYSFPKQAWPPQHSLALHYPTHQPTTYRPTYRTEQEGPFAYTSAPDMYSGTAPPTPDFFATSNDAAVEGGSLLAVPQHEDEVLVGMGLYDPPTSPNSTILDGSQIVLPQNGSAGKGLKLEETFQPSNEENRDDDDDDSNDDEADDNERTEEPFTAPTCHKPKSGDPGARPAIATLADQSFFFDNDPDEDDLFQQTYDTRFTAPIWTDVYSGAPCRWI